MISMKSPIKELSSLPLIEACHVGHIDGPDSELMYKRSLVDSSVTKKKTVTFSSAVITIHYPHNKPADDSSETVPSRLWYSSLDFQRFRSESYQVAAKASGDVDYQHFFLNTIYAKAAAIAASTSIGVYLYTSVPHTLLSGSNMNLTAKSYMSIGIDSFSELCMISKYRGLERIIFRNLVQPSKFAYIEDCIRYYNNRSGQMEQPVDDCSKNSDSFHRQTTVSQIVAQYFGQIDEFIVQEHIRMELQQEQITFTASQPLQLSLPALASIQLLTVKRSKDDNKSLSHRRRCFMEL